MSKSTQILRLSTNRMLDLPGASVTDVEFGGEGVVVTVRPRRRRKVCSACGTSVGLEVKDRRTKRWRHLDVGSCRCLVECELRRLRCRGCDVVALEPVPWARPGAPYTRDFEDVVAWLAQQMAKTPITRLLRVGWASVGKIVERVVADHLDEGRLDGLVWLGVDEICCQADRRFLTCVADHDTGGVAPGRNAQTLRAFLDQLDEGQRASIKGVSILPFWVPPREPHPSLSGAPGIDVAREARNLTRERVFRGLRKFSEGAR